MNHFPEESTALSVVKPIAATRSCAVLYRPSERFSALHSSHGALVETLYVYCIHDDDHSCASACTDSRRAAASGGDHPHRTCCARAGASVLASRADARAREARGWPRTSPPAFVGVEKENVTARAVLGCRVTPHTAGA